jgi:hypothetical protein
MLAGLDFHRIERQLIELAEPLLGAGSKLFVLYDPRLSDPLELAQLIQRGRIVIPVRVPEHIADHDARRPCLIEMDAAFAQGVTEPSVLDDPLLLKSIAESVLEIAEGPESLDKGRAICAWLWSTEPGPALADRLSLASAAIDPAGQRRWLRWHDPRVWGQMWPSLTADQQQQLLAQATACSIDALGELAVYATDAQKSLPSVVQLSSAQFQRMVNCQAVTALLRAWRAFCDPLPSNAVDELHRHLLQASSLQLQGEDVTTYVLYAIQLKPQFHQHPKVHQEIQAARQEPGSLERAWAELDERVWNDLALTPAPTRA